MAAALITREETTEGQRDHEASRFIWAYAYQVIPPQPATRLRAIRSIMDQEQTEARSCNRVWTGRLVLERQVTHILVVSDTPAQDRAVNRALEGALKALKAAFLITVPLAVWDSMTPSS